MAARLSMLVRAFLVSCLFAATYSDDKSFPDINVLNSYSTEVQLSLVKETATVYIKEYYDKLDKRGALSIYMRGDWNSVFYDYDADNDTYQVMDVNSTHCKSLPVDISDFYYTPLYHGWLNKDPLIIGPSAPLWYAKGKKVKYIGTDFVRDIPMDRFDLAVQDKVDNLTVRYYFARDDWTVPYEYKTYTPMRIHVVGISSRYTGNSDIFVEVDQITDFAYFRHSIEDRNSLLPPVGIGCKYRRKSDSFPDIPNKFKYSAEIVDRLHMDDKSIVEVKFERVYFDHPERLARIDRYTRATGYQSAFYDFRGGAAYVKQRGKTCTMSSLRNTELVVYDLGMSGRMMEPKEMLALDGEFYSMGKRKIRGITCDAYESVAYDTEFDDTPVYKLVVTAYFTETITNVGVDGGMESRIPAYILVNGWETATKRMFSYQYNIYGFSNILWPPMYSSFGLDRCYTKPDTRTYFVMIFEVPKKEAAAMEGQDDLIIKEVRSVIAYRAQVPEHRIPFLKADYKTTGVYISGAILERPPALLQFKKLDSGPTISKDPDLRLADANNVEECSYRCIDYTEDFKCKGFFYCNNVCWLKSIDPAEDEDSSKTTDLGICDNYYRVERESTTTREAYLTDAMSNLETAVLNGTLPVSFINEDGKTETGYIKDIVVGDGPYTGVDAGDKPYAVSIEWRKLNSAQVTVHAPIYAATLTDCYKRCKESGSECASFSFCPNSDKEDKECLITPDLLVKGVTPDTEILADNNCNIYNPKYSKFFEPFPEKVAVLQGDKTIRGVESLEKCARNCKMEKDFVCRGFEFCRSMKQCTLHKKHILDLAPGMTTKSSGSCIHYAARFIADYMDLGGVLIDDISDVRYGTSLDECAKICSEELKENCNSFNYCPTIDYAQTSCSLSTKLLRDDGVTTTENNKCLHFEKRDVVHDWDKNRKLKLSPSGYTKKGFTGLVVGMLVVGVVIGVLGFVGYSYYKARSGSGDGLAVRFMKNET